MEELRRLRVNTKLQDLDLRLNPVAHNALDYRLVLVHMLPNLRQLGTCILLHFRWMSWCDPDVLHFLSSLSNQ